MPVHPHSQVRKTFEDMYAEALRMNAGCPSLPPYHLVAQKEITCDLSDGSCSSSSSSGGQQQDPASVLSAAYDAESAASTSGTSLSDGSGAAEPRARPDLGVRPGGLRSHPIGSLLDLPCLTGVTGAQLEAEAAAARVQAAKEGAEAAAAAALLPVSLRMRAYTLLQKLWVASNAALGAAPNAVAELEEMAVLV